MIPYMGAINCQNMVGYLKKHPKEKTASKQTIRSPCRFPRLNWHVGATSVTRGSARRRRREGMTPGPISVSRDGRCIRTDAPCLGMVLGMVLGLLKALILADSMRIFVHIIWFGHHCHGSGWLQWVLVFILSFGSGADHSD